MIAHGITLRPEEPQDVQAIFELTQRAFAPIAYPSGIEGAIINALRTDGDLTLSLVAVRDATVVGHVAFSSARVSESEGL